MITKETTIEKNCLFCASDYHLEMILLPYIHEKIEKEKIVIISQYNLENSIKLVLDRINIEEDLKKKIWNLGWDQKERKLKIVRKEEKVINFIINGNFDFISEENKKIEKIKKEYDENIDIKIVNCFHLDDKKVNVQTLQKQYKKILNTRKI